MLKVLAITDRGIDALGGCDRQNYILLFNKVHFCYISIVFR